MSSADISENQDAIAVIGMAGRFPGARNIDEFWRNIRDGVESITFFSEEELRSLGVEASMLSDPRYVKAGAVLEEIDLFDAAFFGYTPREAEIMDPQQRVFLECAWEALESAGYVPDSYPGRVGVYAGASMNTYLLSNLYGHPDIMAVADTMQLMIGNEKDHVGTRVSYKLNLKGPGISISTSCSTSLVAVHLACQGLLNGECDIALAGGTSIRTPHRTGYMYQEGGIASPDGHCRAFDARAQGTIAGNGVASVVLKRLADALEDGDSIHAIVRGSAINNDGSAKIGYTAPGIRGQIEVITEAQAIAGISPDTIGYIETHGTGTVLGDPVEIAALTEVFRAKTAQTRFCAIGSVKTNIGHLDITAGVTGFIKTVLMLKHRLIPPSLHFEQPNPGIDFVNSPFYVNTELAEWKAIANVRRAGVSAFGLGGTNAHVILEEASPPVVELPARPYHLWPLSARTPSALQRMGMQLGIHIQQHPDLSVGDIASTLQHGRKHFEYRTFIVSQNVQDALVSLPSDDVPAALEFVRERPIVFLFPGQGMQHIHMAQGLYTTEPVFREQVDRCAQLLKPHLSFDLRSLLYPHADQERSATQQLGQMFIAQPALFTIEYALAQLWMVWGVRPSSMIGHSMGEYVAACLSNVLSLEDALALVALRSRLMHELPEGTMLSASLSAQQAQALLHPELSLAANNSMTDSVFAGSSAAIDQLERHLISEQIACRRLSIPRAAHSFMMDAILDRFAAALRHISLSSPQIPYISNVTGTWITEQDASDPDYWVAHLRKTVRFAEGMQAITEGTNGQVLLEVGPGRTLTTLARRHLNPNDGHLLFSSLPHPQDPETDVAFLLNTCGQLWCAGVSIDWKRFYAGAQRRIPLPTYPFERKRYWIQRDPQSFTALSARSEVRADIADWFSLVSWKRAPVLLEPAYQMPTEAARWLVFVDDAGLGCELVKRLEQAGETVIAVTEGERTCKVHDRAYTLCFRQRGDYDILLKELAMSDMLPTHVLHCWSVFPSDSFLSDQDMYALAQERGFYSVLFLLQAIGELHTEGSMQFLLFSNNLYEVVGGEARCPARATMLGFNQVIPYEYSAITCRSVDVVLPDAEEARRALIDQLLIECRTLQMETVIAYRGAYRWVQTVEPTRLEPINGTEGHLRKRGVYLITGGFGGIGSVLADYLAREVQARLVLIGRSELPPQTLWSEWLAAKDVKDDISRRIRQVQHLEALGAEVLVIKADVSIQSDVEMVLTRVRAKFGTVHGLIHTAGIPGGGMIQLQQPDAVADVFAPKVKATLLLEAALCAVPLDFMVLCSSLSSFLGGSGLVDYCAGNAFLDAFAFYHTARSGIRTIAINWDTWREIGMTLNTARVEKLSKFSDVEDADLLGSIEPLMGVEALRRILARSSVSQIVVATRDIRMLQQKYESHRTQAQKGIQEQKSLSHMRPHIRTPYVAPENEHENQIIAIWQKTLGIEQIGIHDNFFELGGDSVMVIQITRLMHDVFHLTIPVHLLFEIPTIAGLAQFVTQKQAELLNGGDLTALIEKVSQMSDEEVLSQLGGDLLP